VAIEHLKERGLGQSRFFRHSVPAGPGTVAPRAVDGAKPARDAVRVPGWFSGAVEALLGDVYLVNDLDQAFSLADRYPSLVFLTPECDAVPGGTLVKGGSPTVNEVHLQLTRGRREKMEERLASCGASASALELELAALQTDGGLVSEEVTPEHVAEVVAKWTHIPVARLMESERDKLMHMEDRLHRRVVGQDEALRAVSDGVRRNRAGLGDPRRPIGSFLFLGPTGVGKTELCKALAEVLFDTEDAMIRIDMSEFMEQHSVARLIGAPPGYVGYEEGGRLTEAVRRKPYCVILFDEIEKAHRDVFNVLLQVLDDGRLTDGHGRTVDFKNTLIVMTSNIASQFIQALAEKHAEQWEIEAQLKDALKQQFRPEFLNRIDETVIFHSLTKEDLAGIVDIQLRDLARRLEERHVALNVTPAARELIGELGYDASFGARPLKRLIQQKIENALAGRILAGEIRDGQTVTVGARGKGLTFAVVGPPAAEATPQPASEPAEVVEGEIVEE